MVNTESTKSVIPASMQVRKPLSVQWSIFLISKNTSIRFAGLSSFHSWAWFISPQPLSPRGPGNRAERTIYYTTEDQLWSFPQERTIVDVVRTGGSCPWLTHQSTCALTLPSDQTSPKTGAFTCSEWRCLTAAAVAMRFCL